MPFVLTSVLQYVMKTISGKSSSLMRPSPLSSSRFTTAGVADDCADVGNGEFTAWRAAAPCPVPPHWISFTGRAFANGTGGSEQVGATPVPVHCPTSQAL